MVYFLCIPVARRLIVEQRQMRLQEMKKMFPTLPSMNGKVDANPEGAYALLAREVLAGKRGSCWHPPELSLACSSVSMVCLGGMDFDVPMCSSPFPSLPVGILPGLSIRI